MEILSCNIKSANLYLPFCATVLLFLGLWLANIVMQFTVTVYSYLYIYRERDRYLDSYLYPVALACS